MREAPSTLQSPLPSALAQWVDRVCDDFETAWHGEVRPQIEDYLAKAAEPERSALVRELILVEVHCRREAGEHPQADDYLTRFPELDAAWAVEATANSPPAPFPVIPGYEFLSILGRGGMGVVYQARQVRLNRLVAVKMLSSGDEDDAPAAARFFAEAKAVACLQHPNIVKIYDFGEHDGRPYLTLEFVDGGSLAQKLTGTPRQPCHAAQLVEVLARAIHCAHQMGIIHRDLKPSNILLQGKSEGRNPQSENTGDRAVSDRGPGIADFDPKITDFGLAKNLESGGRTQSGAILGTPSYMAPEQAAGKGNEIGPGADVYALGAILYELLAGRPPFKAATVLDTLEQVRSQEALSLRRLQPKVPRDLETICLKCLEKEPHRRYSSAEALSQDLQRFLRGAPVLARPISGLQHAGRWCRRNPVISGLACAVTVLLLVVAVGSLLGARRLQRDRDRAVLAEEDAKRELCWSYLAEVRAGHRSQQPGRRFTSVETLAKAVGVRAAAARPEEMPTLLQLRNEMISCLALADLKSARHWPGFPHGSETVIFDTSLERYARSDAEGTIHLHRVGQAEELMRLPGLPAPITRQRFSPDGRFLAVTPADNRLRLWDLERQECRQPSIDSVNGRAVDFHPGSRQLAIGHPSGAITVYDLVAGRSRSICAPHQPAANFISFHPDGRRLAAVAPLQFIVRVYDVNRPDHWQEFTHPRAVSHMSWSADGRLLAAACEDSIYVWDCTQRRKRVVLDGLLGDGMAVAFHPGGDLLATYGSDSCLRLWDLASAQEVFRTSEKADQFRFSADGRWFAFCTTGEDLALLEVAARNAFRAIGPALRAQEGRTHMASVSRPDGRLLAASMSGGTRIWDLVSGHELAFLPQENDSVLFTPGEKELLTAGQDGLQRWRVRPDPASGALLLGPPEQLLAGFSKGISCSSDGHIVAAAVADEGGVVLTMGRKPSQGARLHHPGAVFTAVSPNGHWVATSTWHGRGVKIWEAQTGRLAKELLHQEASTTIGFSPPDGHWLVTSTFQDFSFWETKSWQLVRRIPRSGVTLPGWVAFSPDGKMAALEASPGRVQLLDPETGEEFATLADPYLRRPTWMGFTPDGGQLVVSVQNQRLFLVWDLRFVREELAKLGLDWKLPSLPPADLEMNARPVEIRAQLSAALYVQRAQLHERDEAIESAVADLKEALKLDPNDAVACNNLAWIYVSGPRDVRDPEKALALAQRAVRLQETDPNYLNTLGVVYYRLNQWSRATASLEAAARMHGKTSSAWDLYFLAMSYQRLGESAKARERYHQALQIQKEAALSPEQRAELERIRMEADIVMGPADGK